MSLLTTIFCRHDQLLSFQLMSYCVQGKLVKFISAQIKYKYNKLEACLKLINTSVHL